MASEDELIAARRAKAAGLAEAGTQPYPNDFRSTLEEREESRRALLDEIHACKLDEARRARIPEEGQLAGSEPKHWLFGRVVAKRGPFLVVRTPMGDAQALARNKAGKGGEPALPQPDAAQLELLDLADHVAVHGPLIRTKSGDLAVRADHFQHVGKALLPPPDKWHGLTDVEKRYRERYVDLFASPDVALVFRARALVVHELRRVLSERGFLEVETPILHPLRGGATAKPFETHHNVLDRKLYLRIAPELYLKRLVVGGIDRVFEIGRCFRNEGVSTRHNPEFSMLELYQAYATYEDLMEVTEAMLRAVDGALREAFDRPGVHLETARRWFSARPFTLEHPFARVDLRDAILARLARSGTPGFDPTPFDGKLDPDALRDHGRLLSATEAAMHALGADERRMLKKCSSHGERVFLLYELLAEPALGQLFRSPDGAHSLPVFVTKHPVEVSPLARKSDAEPAVTDRFELFVEGKEVANAFSELNDADDQEKRFEAQVARREGGDDEAMDFDADYVRALRHGMPPAAGLGLGVDRLVMMLCAQPSIRDVLLFPAMRTPEKTG